MLEITIQPGEIFDEVENRFIQNRKQVTIQLEHSLISLRKWEQKWKKAFLMQENLSVEEILDYIRCMTVSPHGISPETYYFLTTENVDSIISYIKDPMTATTFSNNNVVDIQRNSSEGITAEIIYYWMITMNVPVEFEKWHLQTLLTLIRVISIKNQKPQKVDPVKAAIERDRLNQERRKKFNSKG